MSTTYPIRAWFSVVALATTAVGAQGCVADRPSRNGVFNENQYLRKDFLVRPGTDGSQDPGWYMKATVIQASTPNPLANLDIFTGAENSGALVRFNVTQDHLQLSDMREMSNSDQINQQQTRTASIVNSWPITNVDLKYRINLDGEKTNFYEENQELSWQVRQYVKVNFAKNDLSDIAALGQYQAMLLGKCTDAANSSATLVPGSFMVDEPKDYFQFSVSVTAPVKFDDQDCVQLYGAAGVDFQHMGRSTVTFNLMYSFARAKAVDPNAYTPLVIPEKDPIRHKYGAIEITNYSRDLNTGLIAARELAVRYNPNKPIVWYFAPGYPEDKKDMWKRAGTGIVAQTNAILQKAGGKAQLEIHDASELPKNSDGSLPQYGDVRYNFIRWTSDLDSDSPFLGVMQYQPDLRTGELVSASINIADAPLKDFLSQRTSAYLAKVVGADPFADPPPDPDPNAAPGATLPPTCTAGQTIPLVPAAAQRRIFGQSTLYQKMAQYLPTPPDGASAPGPMDYVYQHKGDAGNAFIDAYFRVLPYTTYADPMMNQFVRPADLSQAQGMKALVSTLHGEALFQQAMADLDRGYGLGEISGGTAGMVAAYNQIDNIRQLWQAHRDYAYTWQLPHSLMRGDTPDIVSFTGTVSRSSRACVDGKWQTREDWEQKLLQSYYEQVVWHEFGHIMGLEHNFMGSVDKANFPTYKAADGSTKYGKLSSSIMEYSVAYDDTFWNNGGDSQNPTTGWLPYDQAAIAWIYGNNLSPTAVGPVPPGNADPGISGQVSATAPWNDPLGFNGTTEKSFLFCSHQHMRYTPLCRQFDLGTTPSEITAADIEMYEWNYKWRNFRNYYKVWDDSTYASRVGTLIGDMRRFLAMWAFDWSSSELTDKMIRIGIKPPVGAVNTGLYYSQLTAQFQADVASAEQLIAAFHEAVIQQGSGQRPFVTQYDPAFGDVTQQGISIDKELSLINWLGLWPFDNYDPSQAAGYYGSSLTMGPGNTHPAQSWSAAASMLGEKGPWDAYPGVFPSAVALFAHDTQSPTFTGLGYPQMRDWIGGHTFTRLQDVLSYFQKVAADYPHGVNGCSDVQGCTYNPMTPQINAADIGHSTPTHAFIGPDNRRWTWVYISDRNIWFFVDQDRNPSAYQQVLTYNTDLLTSYDDGNFGPIYSYEARIKYMIDAFTAFGGDTQAQ